jgi:hypothetical protein
MIRAFPTEEVTVRISGGCLECLQHNKEAGHVCNTRWFKYDRDKLTSLHTNRPGHI